MKKNKPITTEDILIKLCNSVKNVLSTAAQTPIDYSPMIQRISKTSLKPDIGLVVINFTADAALEVYQSYLMQMGIPKEELATQHTSDEVGNVMGELMNQILGDFTGKVSHELKTHITQSQPKMLTINKQVLLSIDTNLDRPQARRVSFYTGKNNIFYLELAIDRTEFIQLHEFEAEKELDPDAILAAEASRQENSESTETFTNNNSDSDDLLASLGL